MCCNLWCSPCLQHRTRSIKFPRFPISPLLVIQPWNKTYAVMLLASDWISSLKRRLCFGIVVTVTPLTINITLEIGNPKGNSSSNHLFSGAMLNFGGVFCYVLSLWLPMMNWWYRLHFFQWIPCLSGHGILDWFIPPKRSWLVLDPCIIFGAVPKNDIQFARLENNIQFQRFRFSYSVLCD